MNVRTRDVAIPHSSGYIVGGQPDRTGARVPTKYEPTSSIDRVLQNRESIARGTDDPHAAMGYWRDKTVKDSPFEVDSSTNVVDRSAAKTIGKHRGEKAVWDLGKMEDIRLDGKHD